MATTLPLIAKIKIDTRKDGAIAWARVRVLVDGMEVGADFRAKVGEEPIVIDGDTITAPDAQVATARATVAGQIERAAATDAVLARFGTLAPIAATSDAQLAYAEKSRSLKLPNFAIEIDRRAAKWGWDAAKSASAFAYIAEQTDARFWIDCPTELQAGLHAELFQNLWYHFG